MKYQFVATCLFGLEKFVGEEIDALGCKRTETIDGRVYFEGDEIDLDEILSTCFVLDMETKFLCREDCKGLCDRCGSNLNLGPCGCRKQIDPRFAVLEQLLDKD